MNAVESKGHLIGGEWIAGEGSRLLGRDPSGSQELWNGRRVTKSEADQALRSAAEAFEPWARMSIDDRVAVLGRVVDQLEEHAEDLATAIAASSGKPLWEARTEARSVAAKIKPSVAAAKDRGGEFAPPEATRRGSRTFFRPHGPVVVLGPYNFPVHMPNVHVFPALVAGNTVVVKPSELVPWPGEVYAECFARADVPRGVFNLVQGDGEAGDHLVRNDLCKAICFTGSVATGEHLERIAVERQIMIASEKGGNSPLLVWGAEDLRGALYVALVSCFGTAGQRCSSARRIVVRANETGRVFVEGLVDACTKLRIGDPFATPPVFYGPLINRAAADAALAWQEELESLGGEVLLRATIGADHPALVSPGIVDVTRVPHDRIPDKEVMAPVVTVRFCEEFDEAIRVCNDTRFGLAAGIVTQAESEYRRFLDRIEAGVLTWNAPVTGASAWAPFGGVKHSGNYRPTGYFSADTAVRAVGVTEKQKIEVPETLPPGVTM